MARSGVSAREMLCEELSALAPPALRRVPACSLPVSSVAVNSHSDVFALAAGGALMHGSLKFTPAGSSALRAAVCVPPLPAAPVADHLVFNAGGDVLAMAGPHWVGVAFLPVRARSRVSATDRQGDFRCGCWRRGGGGGGPVRALP